MTSRAPPAADTKRISHLLIMAGLNAGKAAGAHWMSPRIVSLLMPTEFFSLPCNVRRIKKVYVAGLDNAPMEESRLISVVEEAGPSTVFSSFHEYVSFENSTEILSIVPLQKASS